MKRRMAAIFLWVLGGLLGVWWAWSYTHREFIAYTPGATSYFLETGRGGVLVIGKGPEGCTAGWSRYPDDPSAGSPASGTYITDVPTRWNFLGLGMMSRSPDEIGVGFPFWLLISVLLGMGAWLRRRRKIVVRTAFPVVMREGEVPRG